MSEDIIERGWEPKRFANRLGTELEDVPEDLLRGASRKGCPLREECVEERTCPVDVHGDRVQDATV